MNTGLNNALSGTGSAADAASHPLSCYVTRRFPPVQGLPPEKEDDSDDKGALYEVRIIDNDYNTYQEVMNVSMVALNITEEDAYAIAWEVDHMGSCVVAHAPWETAQAIANIIRTIGIEVQVNPVRGTEQ